MLLLLTVDIHIAIVYLFRDAYLIEKSIYELTCELNNRPDWVRTPLRGVLDLLE